MRFFKYWADAEMTAKDITGKNLRLRKWGGSDLSLEDAAQAAREGVEALALRVASLDILRSRHNYEYGSQGRPEELIEKAEEQSIITRNGYGCLVLNTDNVMFVDIDLPYGGKGFFARLLGKTEEKYIARLRVWLTKHPEASVRIYRTAAGLRYLFTHMPLDVNDNTLRWMSELGSDKLYVRLCKLQNCYRARLTPKPWRLKIKPPGRTYPRKTPEQEQAFRSWLGNYEDRSRDYATCKFLASLGSGNFDRKLLETVKKHDSMTRSESDLALA